MSSDVENLAANDNPLASRRLGHQPLFAVTDELRSAGHEVIARNRTNRGDDDLVLSHIDELNIDQPWLMAVDVGGGLTTADAYAVQRFRENGGGVLTARGHHDLGSLAEPARVVGRGQ